MTVRDIYRLSLSIMGEVEADAIDYEPQVPGLMTIMLQELLGANNTVVLGKGGTVTLTVSPLITSMTDAVPYEQEITVGVLPWGLAAKLSLDESARAAYFNAEYMERKNQFTRHVRKPIVDVYADGY